MVCLHPAIQDWEKHLKTCTACKEAEPSCDDGHRLFAAIPTSDFSENMPFRVKVRDWVGECDAIGCKNAPHINFVTTNADVAFCEFHATQLGYKLIFAARASKQTQRGI